jgi:hypothetical protein
MNNLKTRQIHCGLDEIIRFLNGTSDKGLTKLQSDENFHL